MWFWDHFFSSVNLFTFHLPFCKQITWYVVKVLQFPAVSLCLYQNNCSRIPWLLSLHKSILWETLMKTFSEIQVNFYRYQCSSASWLTLWKHKRFVMWCPLRHTIGQARTSLIRFPDSLHRAEMSLYWFAVLWLLHTFSKNRSCFRHFTALWC